VLVTGDLGFDLLRVPNWILFSVSSLLSSSSIEILLGIDASLEEAAEEEKSKLELSSVVVSGIW